MKKTFFHLLCFIGCLLTCASSVGASVNLAGSGSGTVTSSPAGINCGNDCEGDFVGRSEVTLVAEPDSTSIFTGWSDDCYGTDAAITFTLNNDRACTATFEPGLSPDYYTLTVGKDGNGMGTVVSSPAGIDCGSKCGRIFAAGTEVTLTALPGAGDAFQSWTGTDCPGNHTCTVTMDKDQSVVAAFNPDGDGDGVSDIVEDSGPNNGDANEDGLPDSTQANVATLTNINGKYVTFVSDPDTMLWDVTARVKPSPGNAPAGINFPEGFFGFINTGLPIGGATVVELIFHESSNSFSSFYKYGPTADDADNHWYDFLYNNETGAQWEVKDGKTVFLIHFKDGERGDSDLTADGVIVDPFGPGNENAACSDGGGGCFLGTSRNR